MKYDERRKSVVPKLLEFLRRKASEACWNTWLQNFSVFKDQLLKVPLSRKFAIRKALSLGQIIEIF
jgi:hypothetical protein